MEVNMGTLDVRTIEAIWKFSVMLFTKRPTRDILEFCYSRDLLNTAASCVHAEVARDMNLSKEMPSKVVCVGDIHGNSVELALLWQRLEKHMGEQGLQEAAVIFLGDYCDRGPDTKGAYDFLINLRETRAKHPKSGGTYFITGNHDFAFAAYVGSLPISGDPPLDLDKTKPDMYKTGFWPFEVEGGMHYQGRRWGGSATYHCWSTFESYGVQYGDGEENRSELLKVFPEAHSSFLKSLKWIHVQPVPFSPGFVVAVHAGLITDRDAISQVEALFNRDLAAEVLFKTGNKNRIESFVGRDNVRGMHDFFQDRAILVSGHHGFYEESGDRIICDKSGGAVEAHRPLEAIILPERKVIAHCDQPKRKKLGFLRQLKKPVKKR